MSAMIEGGGTFIDYRDPKKVFKTQSISEWNKHLAETKATVSGTAPCAMCSKPVEFQDLAHGTKPVCDSCKAGLVKK